MSAWDISTERINSICHTHLFKKKNLHNSKITVLFPFFLEIKFWNRHLWKEQISTPGTVQESVAVELWDSQQIVLWIIFPPNDKTSDVASCAYLFYHLFSLLEFMSARYLFIYFPTYDRTMGSGLSNDRTPTSCWQYTAKLFIFSIGLCYNIFKKKV